MAKEKKKKDAEPEDVFDGEEPVADAGDGGKKDKKSGGKEPKEPKEKKGKNKKAEDGADGDVKAKLPKEKKNHPAAKAFLRTSAAWLVLIFAFVFLTYMNTFTLKETVLQFLNPEQDFEVMYKSRLDELDAWETDTENRNAELDDRENALNDLESKLDETRSEVELRLTALGLDWDDDLNIIEETPQVTPVPVDITSVAKTISGMTPAKAGKALLNLEPAIAARILATMKNAQSAAILDTMSADESAPIIEQMVSPE